MAERPKRGRLGTAFRWTVRVVVGALLLVLLVLATASWGLLSSEKVARRVLDEALPRVNALFPGEIRVGALSGRLRGPLSLDEVEIIDERGQVAISAKRLRLDWDPGALLRRRVDVAALELTEPVVHVEIRADGTVNIASAFVDPNKPKKDKPPREGPLRLPVSFHAQRFAIVGGQVRVSIADRSEFRFDRIAAEGTWSMTDLDEDFSLKELTAAVVAPWDSGLVRLSGSGTLKTTDLTVDALSVEWLDNRLILDGAWPRVGRGVADLEATIERLALADIKRFAPSAPLDSVVSGSVSAKGALKDLVLEADLSTPDGGRLQLHEGGVKLVDPLAYRVDATLTAFPLREVVPIDLLPESLTGKVEWDGQGTSLKSLAGGGRVGMQPFRLRDLEFGSTNIDADIRDEVVTVHGLRSSLQGGTVDIGGVVDLTQRTFALDAVVEVGDLGQVGRSFSPPLTGGRARLQGRQVGGWGGEGTKLTLRTDSGVEVSKLAVAGTEVERLAGRLALELRLPKRGGPSVEGTTRIVAHGVTAAGVRLHRATVDAVGVGAAADFEVEVEHRRDEEAVELASSEDTSPNGAEPAAVAVQVEPTDPQEGAAEADAVAEFGVEGSEEPLPAGTRVRSLRVGGRVDWGELPALRIDGKRLEIEADGARIRSPEPWTFVTRSGFVGVEGLRMELDPGSLSLSARYDPQGELAAQVKLRGLEASRLRPYLPQLEQFGVEGSVEDLLVRLSGTPAEPVVAVRARLAEVAALSRGPLDLNFELNAGGGPVTGHLGVGSLLDLRLGAVPLALRLDGKGPLLLLDPDGAWDLELSLPDRPLSAWMEPVRVELPDAVSGGAVRGLVTWKGTTEQPNISGSVTLSDLLAEGKTLKLSVGAELDGDRFELRDTYLRELRTQVAKASGSGRLGLGELLVSILGPEDRRVDSGRPLAGDLLASLEFRRLGLEMLHTFVPSLSPLQGALDGEFSASGELSQPRLAAELDILGASLGRRRLDELSLRGTVADGRLDATLKLHPQEGGRLTATAVAPLPLAFDGSRTLEQMLGVPGLQASVSGDGFPLDVALAFSPSFFDAQGAVVLNGDVTGSLLRPVPDMHLLLGDASFCSRSTSVCYERLGVDVALRPGVVLVERLELHTVPQIQNPFDAAFRRVTDKTSGGFDAKGRIELDGWKPALFDLDGKARGMWLTYTPQVQAQFDADIAVDGIWPDLVVNSTVALQDVRVDLGNDELTRDVQSTELPSELRVHRDKTRAGPGEVDAERLARVEKARNEPGLMQRIELHTALALGRNVRVRLAVGLAERIFSTEEVPALKALNIIGNIEPDVRPTGDLNIDLVGGVPRITGKLSVDRGSKLGVLGKKFTLQEGSSIEFGGLVADGVLNLKAIFVSRYGDIEVVVGGTVGEPTIDFQSEAFDSRSDMLSVLVTGRPLSELSAAEGNQTMGLVANALGGFLSKVAGKVVPLDTFQVDLGDDMSSGSVEAGKSIGPRVVLLTRWRWGTDPGENRIEAQVEVNITRGLYLETRIGDALEGSAELVWKLRF